jgi:hypothetical protein
MAGAIGIVVVLLLLFPVLFLMSGAVAAAVLGTALQKDGEARYEGNELLELED